MMRLNDSRRLAFRIVSLSAADIRQHKDLSNPSERTKTSGREGKKGEYTHRKMSMMRIPPQLHPVPHKTQHSLDLRQRNYPAVHLVRGVEEQLGDAVRALVRVVFEDLGDFPLAVFVEFEVVDVGAFRFGG
jgi:hypothetical protein